MQAKQRCNSTEQRPIGGFIEPLLCKLWSTRAQLLLRWLRNVAQVEFSLSSGCTSI